jgi:cytochrome b561
MKKPSGLTKPASSVTRYSRVAMWLHWLIAALVLSTIPIGWYSTWGQVAPPRPASAPQAAPAKQADAANVQTTAPTLTPPPSPPPSAKSPAQQNATNIHKTIGVVILFLTVLRIGWRLTHKPPALPETMARPLRWIARTSHALFYALLVVMPVSGWWLSSAVPNPRRHAFGFGIFDIPFLPVTQSWPAAGLARFIHTSLVWLMVGLAVLHIVAALKHHFVDKDDILKRMLPQKN